MREIFKPFLLLVMVGIASFPVAAYSQASGLTWESGTVLSAAQMNNLDKSKVNTTNGTASGLTRTGGSDSGTDISAANLSADMTGTQAVAAITALQTASTNPSYSNFTPQILFGGSDVGQQGSCPSASYLASNGFVHIWMQCSLSYKGSSTGWATISGVPFNAVGQMPFPLDIRSSGISNDGTQVTASIQADTITIYRSTDTSGSNSVATDSDFENDATITVSGWYPQEGN